MGLRDKEEIHNLSTTQIFLLSTDYELIGFDNYQRLNSRVVIHPARLYALILKVMGRVNKSELDSFIKLIKIDINSEQWISDETMALLNEQLNFYESDTGMQKPYIEAIMESQILQEVDRLPIEQKSEYINRIFEKTSLELAAKEKDRADQAENLISETNERYISTKRQRDIMIAVIVTLFLAIVALLLIFLVLPTLEYNEKTTNQIRIGISSIVIIPTVYKFLKWSIIKIIRKFDKKINK
jgi:cation transport ATPase